MNVLDPAGNVVGSMVWTGGTWEVWSHIEPLGGTVQKVGDTFGNGQQMARNVALRHFSQL